MVLQCQPRSRRLPSTSPLSKAPPSDPSNHQGQPLRLPPHGTLKLSPQQAQTALYIRRHQHLWSPWLPAPPHQLQSSTTRNPMQLVTATPPPNTLLCPLQLMPWHPLQAFLPRKQQWRLPHTHRQRSLRNSHHDAHERCRWAQVSPLVSV